MAAIQTVIIINITISSALLIVLFSDLNTIELIFAIQPFNVYKLFSACALSLIGFLESSLCLKSIKSQTRSCNSLRKKLYEFEEKFSLYTLHKENKLKFSIHLTKIGASVTTITFFTFIFALFNQIINPLYLFFLL